MNKVEFPRLQVSRRVADLSDEKLLAEVDDIIRSMPPHKSIHQRTEENFAWFGRASAAMRQWDSIQAVLFDGHITNIGQSNAMLSEHGYRGVSTMLHTARQDLLLRTVGPSSIGINEGRVFDYFDALRKVIETARSDVLFVDPYLDAEFVSRYLPHIAPSVRIRLMTHRYLDKLVPAVQSFVSQNNVPIEIRSASGLHDRYVFVDECQCYQSGASFKDGAVKSPTTLTQIVDAFQTVYADYQAKWDAAVPQLVNSAS